MLINKGKRSEGWTICVFLHTVTRIIRVIAQPRGNMLLIGIGGSGRQSLSRLSAYIIGFKVFQIEVTKHYRKNEFREGTYERIFAQDLYFIRCRRWQGIIDCRNFYSVLEQIYVKLWVFFCRPIRRTTKPSPYFTRDYLKGAYLPSGAVTFPLLPPVTYFCLECRSVHIPVFRLL